MGTVFLHHCISDHFLALSILSLDLVDGSFNCFDFFSSMSNLITFDHLFLYQVFANCEILDKLSFISFDFLYAYFSLSKAMLELLFLHVLVDVFVHLLVH